MVSHGNVIFVPMHNDALEKTDPIFLIDTSGSTTSRLSGLHRNDKGYVKDSITVLGYEIELIKEISKTRGYGTSHVILWSTRALYCGKIDILGSDDNMELLKVQAGQNTGATQLMCGLKQIDPSMLDETKNKQTDIIIITDGEIQDSSRTISKELRKLCRNKISLSIVAVEKGECNYLEAEVDGVVGNTLYSIIRDNNLTRYVNKFSIYNNLRTEFVNFSNPIVPDSYVPYNDSMFLKSNFINFARFIDDHLESVSKCEIHVNDILKHAHSLSLTIYHYIRDKSLEMQKGIIDLFTNMYKRFDPMDGVDNKDNVSVYELVRTLLLTEVDNHVAGKSTTFTAAKKDRNRKVENTVVSLLNNVYQSITGKCATPLYVSDVFSAPIKTVTDSNSISDDDSRSDLIYRVMTPTLSDISIDKFRYHESCITINEYSIPLLFKIGENPDNGKSANHWIRTIYGRTLNISPSSPSIYYYLMADVLRLRLCSPKGDESGKLSDLYESYLNTFFTESSFDSDNVPFIDTIVSNVESIRHNLIVSAGEYSGLRLRGHSIFYVIAMTYLVRYFKKGKGNNLSHDNKATIDRFTASVKNMCAKSVYMDLCNYSPYIYDDNYDSAEYVDKVEWETSYDELIAKLSTDSMNRTQIIDIVNQDILSIQQHAFNDDSDGRSHIPCIPQSITISSTIRKMTSSSDLTKLNNNLYDTGTSANCVVCDREYPLILTKRTDVVSLDRQSELLKKSRCYQGYKNPFTNSTSTIDLGNLTGVDTDTDMILVENFECHADSIKMDNVSIIDPVSSSKMRIRSQSEFLDSTHTKYPFLKDLDFSNVALAGGFCRSILLKQQMKDFDFFFYGVESDKLYQTRFKTFATDLVNSVRKSYHDRKQNVKFMMMFKPMFNVFEIVCYSDPTNHIDSNFDLTNFHEHAFSSLKEYSGKSDKIGVHDTEFVKTVGYNGEGESDDTPNKTYFEDDDSKGIRMLHRFQFILCKYQSLSDIVKSFDMFPSKVVFNGSNLYFTNNSLQAYQHMINVINLDGGSDLIKHRISKYFKYGFSIVFPPNDRNWFTDSSCDNQYNYVESNYKGVDENRGPISFEIRLVRESDNQIVISHNSNIEKILEKNEELEKKSLVESKALYVSSMFCSFVSICRYVDINGIDYLFPQLPEIVFNSNTAITPYVPITSMDIGFNTIDAGAVIKFKNRVLEVNLMDRYNTMYGDRHWYTKFYKSMLLIDKSDSYRDPDLNYGDGNEDDSE
jgi:hypothetical protein